LKYYPVLFQGIKSILNDVFFEDRYADQAISFHFKRNKKWGRRDRSFVAETSYDCIRWWSRYWALLKFTPNLESLDQLIEVSLWSRGLPFFSEPFAASPDKWIKQFKRRSSSLKPEDEWALPKWLFDYGVNELGRKRWSELLEDLNRPNGVVLRLNPINITSDELIERLHQEGVEVEKLSTVENGLILTQRKNVFATESFRKGFFEVQDGSSQFVAPYLSPQPGEFVVDACAGAGGKTLHLASLMKGKGRVLALDIHDWKLADLKSRARRHRLQNIEIKQIQNSKVIKRLYGKADALLLDVPCSGIGVVRRNPDTKWKLSKEKLQELSNTQMDIITQYSKMVKPGGRMVYATCSLFPSENEKIVERFLSSNSDWKRDRQKTIYPLLKGFDGFYMASLQKELH